MTTTMIKRRAGDPVVLSAVVGFLLVLLREKPTLEVDPGIFTSIFGRLRAGDKLYVEIFDNKSPLFFYTGTLMSYVFGPRGLFVLDAILIIACAVLGALIGREVGLSRYGILASGVITAALVTNPITYVSGMTQLCAMTLLLGATLMSLRGQVVAGGALCALAVLFKLPMIVFLPPFVIFGLIAHGRQAVIRAVLGASATTGIVLAIVAVRGELSGYFGAIRVNAGYTDLALETFGSDPAPRGTASFVFNTFQEPALLWPALWTVAAALLAARFIALGTREHGFVETLRVNAFAVLALGFMGSAAVYFLVSAFFEHHLQVFALPASLAAIFLLANVKLDRWSVPAVVLPVILALASLWGIPGDLGEIDELADRWEALDSAPAQLVEDTIGVTDEDEPVTIAMASETAERGMLYFLDDGYEFDCRYVLHQPWFGEDRLDEHLECLADGPDVIVDFEPASTYIAGSDTYAAYWEGVYAILDADYELLAQGENREGFFRVWGRSSAALRSG